MYIERINREKESKRERERERKHRADNIVNFYNIVLVSFIHRNRDIYI